MRAWFVFFILISCGQVPETVSYRGVEVVYHEEPATAEDYSYEFSTLKCTTGVQSFDTFIKACEGLKNHKLNNDCAKSKRENLFLSEQCPGSFET